MKHLLKHLLVQIGEHETDNERLKYILNDLRAKATQAIHELEDQEKDLSDWEGMFDREYDSGNDTSDRKPFVGEVPPPLDPNEDEDEDKAGNILETFVKDTMKVIKDSEDVTFADDTMGKLSRIIETVTGEEVSEDELVEKLKETENALDVNDILSSKLDELKDAKENGKDMSFEGVLSRLRPDMIEWASSGEQSDFENIGVSREEIVNKLKNAMDESRKNNDGVVSGLETFLDRMDDILVDVKKDGDSEVNVRGDFR